MDEDFSGDINTTEENQHSDGGSDEGDDTDLLQARQNGPPG
jgi:hypothetical protein